MLDKYILYLGQIYFVFWTNIFCILDKTILYFGQIYFGILDKYILRYEKGETTMEAEIPQSCQTPLPGNCHIRES